MYYFLDNRLDANSSGIEHAEVKRFHLFQTHHVAAKLVNRDYNRTAHQVLANYDLTDADVVNMFDYFAGTLDFPHRTWQLADLKLPKSSRVVENRDGYQVFDGQRRTMYINWFDATSRQIDNVWYLNGDNNPVRQDYYDSRGFRSFSKFLATEDGHLVHEAFYRPDGTTYYQIFYEQRGKQVVATNILVELRGQTYSYLNIDQVFRLFLDDLNAHDGDAKSTFISDRSNITNWPMINMRTPARKIEHFHNIHFRDFWDPEKSPLTYPSIAQTELLSRTDLIITPSPEQAADMRKRLRTQVPITNVPVGIVPDEQLQSPQIPMAQRTSGKVLAIARLFWEKRLADAIQAFANVHAKLPELTFDIYGYGDSRDNYKEEKQLKALVESLKLTKVVQFKGYVQNVQQVYDQAQVLLMSSRFEGAPLAIVEAAAHGVPTISYDTHYGPRYLVQNNQSGFVVPDGNVEALTEKLQAVFSDSELLQRLSSGAYENAKRFSGDAVWAEWQEKVIKH